MPIPSPFHERTAALCTSLRFKDWAGLPSLPFALPVTLDRAPPVGSAARDPGAPGALIVRAFDAGSGVEALEVQVGAGAPAWRLTTAAASRCSRRTPPSSPSACAVRSTP